MMEHNTHPVARQESIHFGLRQGSRKVKPQLLQKVSALQNERSECPERSSQSSSLAAGKF